MINREELDSLPWSKPAAVPPRIEHAILHACAEDLKPGRPVSAARRALWSVLASGAMFVALLAVGWSRHPPETAVVTALLGALAWGVVQALLVWVGLARPPGRRFTRSVRWGAVLLVLGAFLGYLTLAATSMLSPHEFVEAPRSLRGTVVCAIHALVFGLLATAALLGIWSRTDPFSPGLSGAVAGLGGGLVGAVALDMTCASREAWHLWLGHGLTLVVVVGLAWLAGRRWLSP
ncbi:MAG: DUF1109 family protein [Polyangiaceae bacterium]|nr:DUF1109 family protein [Polyangiaceae bacterium]